ncbi:MAG: tRNA lysidine(34) synthetase TilS [Pseudomonadota bacterium]
MSAPRAAFDWTQVTPPLGLAVSGGSDSTALLMHAARKFEAGDLRVATVDHGLRPQAAQEAKDVAALCATLGIAHDTLPLHLDAGPNLQARARRARYAALAQWGRAEGLSAIALGHTRDDIAESFLMRLARGSGVDGLAAMPAEFIANDQRFIRPLLDRSRAELRGKLVAKGVGWTDDPSNDNPEFQRVAMRHAQPDLDALGLTAGRLSETARWMQAARDVLEQAADDWIAAHARADHGDAVLDLQALIAAPDETRYRVLTRALCGVSGQPYRPRFAAVEALPLNSAATLHGCLLYPHRTGLRITREVHAMGKTLDPRWQVDGPFEPDFELRPLGAEGLSQLASWRETALVPRRSLLASPAVWHGPRLIAAPLAAPMDKWRATAPNPLKRL